MIGRIDKAVRDYPYATATACGLARTPTPSQPGSRARCPELELDLPPTAIGKDYLGTSIFASAPSGHGVQLSLVGLLGVAVSAVDGLEINLLGLNFGVSPGGVKLPIVGFIGPRRQPGTSEAAQPAVTSASPAGS